VGGVELNWGIFGAKMQKRFGVRWLQKKHQKKKTKNNGQKRRKEKTGVKPEVRIGDEELALTSPMELLDGD